MAVPLTYKEIMDQLALGNGMAQQPLVGMPGGLPPAGPPQPAPFDTSVVPEGAFGMPYPGGLPAPEDTGEVPPATDVGAAPAPSSSESGYAPQPRPELPKTFTRPKNADLFGDYTSVYNPPGAEDPLAAMMAGNKPPPGMPGAEPPPDRSLTPPWMTGGGGPQYGAGGPQGGGGQGGQALLNRAAQQAGPTQSEKALMRKSPAYGRAIDRIRTLDRMRGRRGV